MYHDNHYDYDFTMSYYYDDSDTSFPIAGAVLSTHAQLQHQPETSSAVYKLAARNLREHHGVRSMTALKLEKTLALLGLRPRRIVAQGLAPRRLLMDGSSPLFLTGESSDESQEGLRKAETRALILGSSRDNFNNNYDNAISEEEEEVEEDSNSTYDNHIDNIGHYGDETKGDVEGLEADVNGNENAKKKRPFHAALVAGGVNLRPRETRPLFRALGVSPRRLVRLGLVKREEVRAEAGRRGGGPGQHLRSSGPGHRGVGGPRVGGRRGPPHVHGGCSPGSGPPRRLHGPPRRPVHGAGRHAMRREEECEGDGMAVPHSPLGGPIRHGPRHHGGRLQGPPHGPGHHSMPTVRYGCAPPGGGKHGHGHGHCGGGFHGEGEEGKGGRGGAGGLGQHGPRRHGGSMGGPRGPPPGLPHARGGRSPGGGPSRPMNGPSRRPFHGTGHHTMHPGEESEEEGMLAPLDPHGAPGHHGSRHHGRGGMGRCRCRPQEPPHVPVHGPFRGLSHEKGAPGAPPGVMAHPRHGSPPRGGGGMKQHDGRNGGGTRFYGGETGFGGGGGGLGGGGGDMEQWWRAHLAHFHGGRHQPQLEAY